MIWNLLQSWFLFLTFSTVYVVSATMAELWKITLGDREGSGSQSPFFFSFLIQLLQQPLVKKVESGADTLNIYLEQVGIRN